MKNVLCFGEILLRLSPDIEGNWLKNSSMPVYMGGAELNVAQALACWQIPVKYYTAMPDNYLARGMKTSLAENGIDVSRILTSGDRVGIYYLAQGTDLKNSEVVYDRANSSTATMRPGEIDWDSVLAGIDWFHFTAITPAINKTLADICLEAVQAAARKKITISVDLNYRSKLWKWGKEPLDVMPELVEYCNMVMGNIWAAEQMLGIRLAPDFKKEKAGCVEQAQRTSQEIARIFPACDTVANTFRFDQGGQLLYYGTYYADGQLYVSQEHQATDIKDKVGSGDCFMAGLIYGSVEQYHPQDIINFAAAAAVDKMFIVGDATQSGVEKIRQRIESVKR